MDVGGTAAHLDQLGLETWTDLVRRLLDDDRAEVLEHHQEPIFIGVGTGTQLHRVAAPGGSSARVGDTGGKSRTSARSPKHSEPSAATT